MALLGIAIDPPTLINLGFEWMIDGDDNRNAAVDKGVALANVSDRYTGQAPGLGALEAGEAVPHYGPRP